MAGIRENLCHYKDTQNGSGAIRSYQCHRCGHARTSTYPPGMLRRSCPAARRVALAAGIATDASDNTPPLRRQAWDLAKAMAAFIADGLKTVDQDEYKRRMGLCDTCEHRARNRCSLCGCNLSLKVAGRVFECPDGRWVAANIHSLVDAK